MTRRSAIPMVIRCAQHQLGVDPSLHQHLLAEKRAEEILCPNLLLMTTVPGPTSGCVPVLILKAG